MYIFIYNMEEKYSEPAYICQEFIKLTYPYWAYVQYIVNIQVTAIHIVHYHSGGSMKLNACILHLVYMVYL